jgi:hypothetical protein
MDSVGCIIVTRRYCQFRNLCCCSSLNIAISVAMQHESPHSNVGGGSPVPTNDFPLQSNDTLHSRSDGSESTKPTMAHKSSPKRFSKFRGPWKDALSHYYYRYGMPSQMVGLIFLGFFAALGHHLYYQNLHDQAVQDSHWPVRFGTAVAFFVKASFIASVEIAYRQQAWVSSLLNVPLFLLWLTYDSSW